VNNLTRLAYKAALRQHNISSLRSHGAIDDWDTLFVRDKNVFTSPEEDFDEHKNCDGCSNSTAVCWMCVSTAASGGSDLLDAFEKL
jgi:hypothetical protein